MLFPYWNCIVTLKLVPITHAWPTVFMPLPDFFIIALYGKCCGKRHPWTNRAHAGSRGVGGGIRRGLGPGGTRGTIELLCRGGGGIAALEVPSGGVQNTTFIPAFRTRAPVFLGGSWGGLSGPIGGWNKADSRAEAEGKRGGMWTIWTVCQAWSEWLVRANEACSWFFFFFF